LDQSFRFGVEGNDGLRVLWEDGELVFCRGSRLSSGGERAAVLVVLPATERPTPSSLDRLAHQYMLKDELEAAWAVRPLELVRERGQTMLVLEDPGGEPLSSLLGKPMEPASFLRLASGVATALAKLHQRGLVHKDLKPAHILVNCADQQARLTGFGIASRLPRERQAPEPPEVIAGTLAYMAPEQTGRMNRSIDARSDLYALGITFYQMLTGVLPFTAADPMEWVHCHIARKAVPPGERLDTVPSAVSQITMKLLAKTAEQRYQTAFGVEHDLDCCLRQWETRGRIDEFPLGARDVPDRLLIPERLYGRERDIETLLAAFDRVGSSGVPELVLVSGYSGIGKSSVVNELHKVLVPSRALFASGKFDQYKRDIPYSTLAQAFQSLVRPLLGKSDPELSGWRDALQEALGPNGRLMVDVVPELKLIIGEQPPVPELPPQDAQRRFQLVFRRFIGVFARPEHPLALFLDDLQWLDAATLDLLEDLLIRSDLQHLMLIGAYRDNEVTAAHPLMRKLATIKAAGLNVAQIVLAPLAREHLGQLIADALHCSPQRSAPLAQLVHEKTGGNPFFAIQFLSPLADEGMLTFDHDAARWSWDLGRIHAKRYTDSVVDLLVGKLTRLPAETQKALQQLACLGHVAETTTLGIVLGAPEEQVHAALWEAVRQELVERLAGAYRFVHDRVHEAAYVLLAEELREEAHLRIGRLLAAHFPSEKWEQAIFEIVTQLNRGSALIHLPEEREQAAELNLVAGKRAKTSTAYASALQYLATGRALLPDDLWDRYYRLAFDLELHRAECEFLTGALADADERLSILSGRAKNSMDRAEVTRLRLDIYTTLGRSDRAVEVSLEYLRQIGIEWSAHPTKEEVQQEYERVWQQLGARPIEDLARLPMMTDPLCLSTLEVLASFQAPARFIDENLPRLVASRMTNISLDRGNSDASPLAYVWFGQLLTRFGYYQNGLRFGKLGVDLVEKVGLGRLKARVYLAFGHSISPWNNHVNISVRDLMLAFEAAQKVGDLTFASYARSSLVTLLLFAGAPLSSLDQESEDAVAFIRRARFGLVAGMITASRQLIKTLRGRTDRFGSFTSSPEYDEGETERWLETSTQPKIAACWYWIRKLQARFFACEWAAAINAAAKAKQLLWTSQSNVEEAEYLFYGALALAGHHEAAVTGEKAAYRAGILELQTQLQALADNCPENFENRAALVSAEIARIEGRTLDAENLYEQAIRSAREHDFVQNEGIANELAGRFYLGRGLETNGYALLRNARYCYVRWGADGKVRQLDEMYPHLMEPAPAPTSTIGTPVEHLDLATVLKVSQTVSGEIVLEKLIDTLLRTAIQHAGAERGLLVLSRGAEQRSAAEATTGGATVVVHLRDEPVTAAVLAEAVLHHVLRTRENVILDDAAAHPSFATDPYITRRQARSILCVPLINQAKLIGALYLENNLTPGVFVPGRIAVLKLLASQAAIALENARLYRDLTEREARIRRLVDANIIGIIIWELEGRILEANDAFLRMVGYDRKDLVSGRLRWTDLTPSEWLDHHERWWIPKLKMTGSLQPFEKEYVRKDGSRVPVLVGVASFDESGNKGVSFVLDLTGRKQAEAEARESERRYRELQMELAHANRVATMGQLTGSIAHEVNQPLMAIVTNAETCLAWLADGKSNLGEARQAAERIIRNGHRAGDIIRTILALARKSAPEMVPLDLNEAIQEVLTLMTGELRRHEVLLETRFAAGLALVVGDRTQLQQVILNLVANSIEAMSASIDQPRTLRVKSQTIVPDGVLVEVEDTGAGIDPTTMRRIFDAFFTTKSNGLGMGLSICRSIVEAHGGRLWASANVPRGSVFHFTVPASADGISNDRS
jgi:PAS domain S-box-containing protein